MKEFFSLVVISLSGHLILLILTFDFYHFPTDVVAISAPVVEEANHGNSSSSKFSAECDSDSSKPRIRVRRLSGDKLSGCSSSMITPLITLDRCRIGIFHFVCFQFPNQTTLKVDLRPVKPTS